MNILLVIFVGLLFIAVLVGTGSVQKYSYDNKCVSKGNPPFPESILLHLASLVSLNLSILKVNGLTKKSETSPSITTKNNCIVLLNISDYP